MADAAYATAAVATMDIVDPPAPECRTRSLPGWARGHKNLRGLINFSRSHFYAVVAVKGPGSNPSSDQAAVVGEAVIDTGGSRSLIDADSAEQYGLQVTVGDAGFFWGPGNKAEPYYGKVEGPVSLTFGEDLTMVLPDLRVVKGTRTDPLFIVGADMMAPEHPGAWDFLNVGFDPQDKRGVMNFINGDGEVRQVELASWPQRATRWVHPPAEDAPTPPRMQKAAKGAKTVRWSDRKKDVNSGKQLIALLKEQGRRV